MPTPPMLGQNFAFALGRLGTLEQNLLQQTDVDRLLGAHSAHEAVKMLRDLPFIATPDSEESFQKTLDRSITKLRKEIENSVPKSQFFLFDILWLEFDRARLSYAEKETRGFVSTIAEAPEAPVSTAFAPSLDLQAEAPEEIDERVADAIRVEQKRLAKRSGSALIEQYVEKQQILEQLRSAKRREEEKNADVGRIVAFEQEGKRQLQELLQEMQRQILGPEALFSYAVRTLQHIQLLKVLLTGKVNGLPIQEIKALLPPLL